MTLPDGKYTLEASPIVPVYATYNGLDKIITVVQKNLTKIQVWDILAVKGKQDVYVIFWAPFAGSEFWTLEDDSSVPRGPIIATRKRIGEWYIVPLDNGRPFSYTIRPVTKAVGVDYYLATNNENQVVIKALPIGDPNVPYWQIHPDHPHKE